MTGAVRAAAGQPWKRLVVIVVAFVVVGAALFSLGVGGYRQGGMICTGLLLLAGAAPAFWRLRDSANRGLWTAVFVIVAVVGGGVLSDRAPWSAGRLAEEMDDLDLPFFEVQHEARDGHSWCKPTCPVVTRTYRAPNTAVRPTMVTIVSSFVRAGLIANDPTILQRIGAEPTARLRTDRVQIDVRVGEVEGKNRVVELRYRALKGG